MVFLQIAYLTIKSTTMGNTFPSFESRRLLLRPTVVTDAEFILKLMNSPLFLQFVGDRNLRTLKESEKYIQIHLLRQWENHGFGSFTIIEKASNIPIGVCGLYKREKLNGIDIGYGILPMYHRRGFAYEAASCIIHQAFTTYKMKELYAIVHPQNKASLNLLEKLGMILLDFVKLQENSPSLMRYLIESPRKSPKK
ncbi:MAG: GNAT family N-acetyltransferase [Flavobacteriaceae bacterium]|nr:GNAT family N-acetyltransferase [Flavobacteriaceae bacterium]